MVNFAGHIAGAVEHGIPSDRPSWIDAGLPLNTSGSGWVTSTFANATHTPVAPAYLSQNHTGHLGGSYGDIFYNRILIEPSTIDLGNLVANQTREIKVFNGYFSNRTLESITETNVDGLSLAGDKPPPDVLFGILQERTYTLEILVNGPPSVDASFRFSFTGSDSPTLFVTGSRIVVLPYYIDAPANERLQWLTGIMVSRNGTEQRTGNRTRPRQMFTTTAVLNPNELNRAGNLLHGWRDRLWAIPTWTETRLAETVSSGATTITVDTRYGDFRTGELAMIWTSPRTFDVFEILSFNQTSITLDRGVNADYVNGMVTPVRIARMGDDPSRLTTGFNGHLQTNFHVDDNPTYTPQVATETYNGFDVYTKGPLLNPEFVTDRYNKLTEIVDYGTGGVDIFAPWDDTKIEREFRLLLGSLKEVWEFKSFLAARRGRLNPFYMPTFENNLRLLSVGTLTTPIVIRSDEQATQAQTRVTIAINTDTGWLFRTVLGYSTDIEGNTVAALNSSLNIDASEVNYISYMGLKRLTSDSVQFNWLPNYVAEVSLGITEISP